jgi:methanogenic corrinoid protein MtbC1
VLDNLRVCIHEVRELSRNPRVAVLVGGLIFAGHPERVKFVGADASGLDGKQAPAHAERLIARWPGGR